MNDPAQQPVPQIPVDQTSQQPVVPAATPHKEAEPVANVPLESPAEYMKPSEVAEPVIPKEVAEAGVEAVSETPSFTPAHQQAGIAPAKESVPVQTQPTDAVQLPKTQQEAMRLLKKEKDPKNSWAWLLTWIVRQFKISHNVEQSESNEKKAA